MIFLRYYIPARRINVAKLGLFIRKDWLDKLNMAEPTTTEEWVAYLRAAKEAKLGGEQTVPYAMKLYVCGGMLPILAGGASHILFEQTIHGLLAANADLLGNIPLGDGRIHQQFLHLFKADAEQIG